MSVAPISMSGLISGLDSATLVQQLMALERQPIYDLERRVSVAERQREAYQDVNTRLLSLKTAAEALSGATTSEERAVTSSAPNAMTGTASVSAVEGTYTFRIMAVAQASQVGSDAQAAGFTFSGAGSIDIDIDGVFAGSAAVAAGETLQDAADAVNALGIDATASVLFDGTDYRLLVTSKVSGADGQMTVTDTTGDLSFGDITVGRDAEIQLGTDNPLTITSADNTFADVIPGLSFTVYRETLPATFFPFTSAETVTLTVGPAVSETDMAERVKAFVDAYNDVVSRIDGLSLYDAENEQTGLLQSDTTLRFIKSDLSRFIVDPVAGLPDALNMLFQIGITLDGDGALQLDESVLDAKLQEDLAGVEALFSDAADGISERFSTRLDYITQPTGGQITYAIERLDEQISGFEDEIERLDELLDMKEARLREQFVRMEVALAELQAQSSFFLQQLSLTGSSSGGGLLGTLMGG